MFATVIPLLGLPRAATGFDYAVPNDLAVAVGDLVRVPFQRRSVSGLVCQLSKTTVHVKVRDIESVTLRSLCAPKDIDRLMTIAKRIVQSPGSVFRAAFGDGMIDERDPKFVTANASAIRVSKSTVEMVQKGLEQLHRDRYLVFAADLDATLTLAHLLRKKVTGQMLLLAPTEMIAENVARSINFGSKTALLHGKTSPKERGRIIRAWRNGMIDTLIGTRQAALLPAKKIAAVIVLEAGNREYLNDRKNPRLDTRECARLLTQQHSALFVSADPLPRPEDFQELTAAPIGESLPPAELVDTRAAENAGPVRELSEPLISAIKKALQSQKKVLLFHNRKGGARRLACATCRHVIACSTCAFIPTLEDDRLHCRRCGHEVLAPSACPVCKKGMLTAEGLGNTRLAQTLQRLLPEVTIAQIERGKAITGDAAVLLVTEYFFTRVMKPFAAKTFRLVADVAFDLALLGNDFRADEEAARKLTRLRFLALRQGAECLVQTEVPEVVEQLVDTLIFLHETSELRARYGLPPSCARIVVRHIEPAALSEVSGFPGREGPEALSAEIRVPYSELDDVLSKLSTLPDAAVITLDASYVDLDRSQKS